VIPVCFYDERKEYLNQKYGMDSDSYKVYVPMYREYITFYN